MIVDMIRTTRRLLCGFRSLCCWSKNTTVLVFLEYSNQQEMDSEKVELQQTKQYPYNLAHSTSHRQFLYHFIYQYSTTRRRHALGY